MSGTPAFSFGDESVANAYDTALVPVLFEPWAARLLDDHGPWSGRQVLDLASGTGVVARLLADQVGPDGRVIAVDINPQMLALARRRCADTGSQVEFLECPADSLAVPDDSVDAVLCQQGFQFFPDTSSACREAYRVLVPGGTAVASTWHPVAECEFFGAVCDTLETLGEPQIAATMRLPFDRMSAHDLFEHFEAAGFLNLRHQRQALELRLPGGPSQGVRLAYATPIGPSLRALDAHRQQQFERLLLQRLTRPGGDGVSMGRMVASTLAGDKPLATAPQHGHVV